MAIQSGQLKGELTIDTSKAEKALANVRDFVNFIGKDLKDLSNISITPDGKVVTNFKATSDAAKNLAKDTDSAEQRLKSFYREQRVQDRTTREATQALLGFTFGMSALLNASSASSEGIKRFEKAILSAVTASQGAEFTFASLGIAGRNLGGSLGAVAGFLSKNAGWMGAIVGIGAGLIQLFHKSNEEAKKAAEEGLKAYNDMLDKIAERMQDFTPETAAARRTALTTELNQTEARLAILRRFDEARKKGVSASINVSEEEIKAAGGSINELIRLTGSQLDAKMKELRQRAQELSTEINSIPNFITAKKPVITKDDAKKQAEDDLALQKEMDKSVVGREEALQESLEFEKLVYEANKQTSDEYIKQLRAIQQRAGEGEIFLQAEIEINRVLDDRKKKQEEIAEQQRKASEEMLNQSLRVAELLGRAFSKSGDDFIAKLTQALQIAINIAKITSKDTSSPLDFLEILGNVALAVAMFDKGGYTGSGDPKEPVGIAHKEEVYFESGITKKNKNNLLQLRANLQAGKSFSEAVQNWQNPYERFMINAFPSEGSRSVAPIVNVPPVVIDFSPMKDEIRALGDRISAMEIQQPIIFENVLDTQKLLRKEMPTYNEFDKQKYPDGH